MRYLAGVALTLAAVMVVGCASNGGGPIVSYEDPKAVERVTIEYGSTDLHLVTEKMVQSLITSPVLDNRPVIWIDRIKNKTSDEIDTKMLTNKIRTALLKSGRARFAASDAQDAILDQQAFQSSGLVDPATRKRMGRQVGADYILGGEINSITKTNGKVKDVYYVVTLNLYNVETGLVEWSDEKEIRKQARRRKFGY